MLRRLLLVSLTVTAIGAGIVATAANSPAAFTPNGTEYHALTFPVLEQVSYTDDFGGSRNHPGNDLMGAKLMHELAANDGTVTFLRTDSSGHSGNMMIITGTDGWKYWYIHVNNDTPGTDDGANPAQWRFAPGIVQGAHVTRGQFVAYMGDSGEAETTAPHLHFELHRPDDSFIDPYTSLRLAQGAGTNGLCRLPNIMPVHPSASAGRGFYTVAADGNVQAFGNVTTHGRPPAITMDNPYVAIASTPSGNGYFVTDSRGNVYGFGDAVARGGMGEWPLNAPVISIAVTSTGNGYWLLGRDGGIFGFGDARFWGSAGAWRLNAPVISMAATKSGNGYWLLGADGGIFGFGDGRYYGSTGAWTLNAPVDAMTVSNTGNGYLLLAQDGGMFAFGDAKFEGSLPSYGWCPGPIAIAMASTQTGLGYWMLLDDGRVLTFGDANPWGQPSNSGVRAVSMAAAH